MLDVDIENTDLFEAVKQKMCYEYISDLRDMNRNIEYNLDYALLALNPEDYTSEQCKI